MTGYLRDVLVMAAATALSRMFGLFRDVAIAERFGASAAYDAFIVAFFVPHLLRRLLAEGALSTAFVPAYTASMIDGEDAHGLANNVLSILLLVFPLIAIVGILLAPYYVPFLASGFDQAKLAQTVLLARILFPFIALVGLASVFTGILHAHHRFLLPALSPVLFNVGMLVGALLLWKCFPEQPVLGLAIGALIGGAGQLVLHLPAVIRLGMRFRFVLWPLHPRLRQIAGLMTPALLTLAITQVNLLVDNKLASHLGDGSISALQYATRLFQLPLGVFAVSVAAALLPRLAASATQRRHEQLSVQLQHGLLMALFVLLPSALGLLLVGRDAVTVLFEHGRFTADDTVRTAHALAAYTLGIVPYGLTYVFTRAFYSLGRGVYPLAGMALAVAANVTLDLLLVGTMRETGLAVATSLAGIVNAAVLAVGLRSMLRPAPRQIRQVMMVVAGSALLGFAVWGSQTLASELPPMLRLATSVTVGAIVYGAFARMSGLHQLLTGPHADPEV